MLSRITREYLTRTAAIGPCKCCAPEAPEQLPLLPPMAPAEPEPSEDDCCGDALGKAIASGKLASVERWTHSKCGCEWTAAIVGDVRVWRPVVMIEVWK